MCPIIRLNGIVRSPQSGDFHVQLSSIAHQRHAGTIESDTACLAFAESINATVTGLYVMPSFHALTFDTDMVRDIRELCSETRKAFTHSAIPVLVYR